MAEVDAGNYGGYNYETVREESHDFNCMICFMLMRQPIEFNCGHCVCSGCYVQLKNQVERPLVCPKCRQLVARITLNLALQRLILAIMVKCKHSHKGCSHTCELRDMKVHLAVCGYEEAACNNIGCDIRMERRKLPVHLASCVSKILKKNSLSIQRLRIQDDENTRRIHSLKAKIRKMEGVRNAHEAEIKELKDTLLTHNRYLADMMGMIQQFLPPSITESKFQQSQQIQTSSDELCNVWQKTNQVSSISNSLCTNSNLNTVTCLDNSSFCNLPSYFNANKTTYNRSFSADYKVGYKNNTVMFNRSMSFNIDNSNRSNSPSNINDNNNDMGHNDENKNGNIDIANRKQINNTSNGEIMYETRRDNSNNGNNPDETNDNNKTNTNEINSEGYSNIILTKSNIVCHSIANNIRDDNAVTGANQDDTYDNNTDNESDEINNIISNSKIREQENSKSFAEYIMENGKVDLNLMNTAVFPYTQQSREHGFKRKHDGTKSSSSYMP